MGQAQDFSLFDRHTGRGLVLGGYNPFWNGLSSDPVLGSGIWGFDGPPGTPASVAWVRYLP